MLFCVFKVIISSVWSTCSDYQQRVVHVFWCVSAYYIYLSVCLSVWIRKWSVVDVEAGQRVSVCVCVFYRAVSLKAVQSRIPSVTSWQKTSQKTKLILVPNDRTVTPSVQRYNANSFLSCTFFFLFSLWHGFSWSQIDIYIKHYSQWNCNFVS